MINLLLITIGIFLGIFLKNIIPKMVEKYIIKRKFDYRVKFHVYFLIHKKDSKTNDLIKTESVDILIRCEDESCAADSVIEMINKEFRVEIESIEKI